MKIRKGHVTNSSSSSYILALGKVVDIEKCKAWIQSLIEAGAPDSFVKYNTFLGKPSNTGYWSDDIKLRKNKIEATNFCTSVELENADEDTIILLIESNNNEGDVPPFFTSYEHNGKEVYDGPDYSRETVWSALQDWQRKAYSEIGTDVSGVENVDKVYGAARNG